MAIINGLYIHVISETVNMDVDATVHPVESGLPITDTVRAKPLTVSISGKIVNYGETTASEVVAKIKSWKDSGSLIEYFGRNSSYTMHIHSFQTSHPNTISGGADFTMELKQLRIASSPYAGSGSSVTRNLNSGPAAYANTIASTIEVGSIVVFAGGKVYATSDAKDAVATRGRSTCEVTIISDLSSAIHKYHLVSTDGGMVYGWVDEALIALVQATSTNGKTNAGTQQTKKK